jgi:hypothetical protein
MIKAKYLPTYTAHSFYEIPSSFYLEQGLKNILLDLDNTLAPYKEKEPSEETKAWVSSLQKEGLHLYIASNNTSKRVTRYAKLLGVKALVGPPQALCLPPQTDPQRAGLREKRDRSDRRSDHDRRRERQPFGDSEHPDGSTLAEGALGDEVESALRYAQAKKDDEGAPRPLVEGEKRMSQLNVVRRCYNCGAILQSEKPGEEGYIFRRFSKNSPLDQILFLRALLPRKQVQSHPARSAR